MNERTLKNRLAPRHTAATSFPTRLLAFGRAQSCALIGPGSRDVMTATLHTTNQREGDMGNVRPSSPGRGRAQHPKPPVGGREAGPRGGGGGSVCRECRRRVRFWIHGASRGAQVSCARSILSPSPSLGSRRTASLRKTGKWREQAHGPRPGKGLRAAASSLGALRGRIGWGFG